MVACWFRAHQAERPKYFPLGFHRCCSLALDKSPRECFVKNKNGSCLTASSMMLTNPCVIKERESHGKLKPAARPPGRGVRWLGSGTSDSCSSAERRWASPGGPQMPTSIINHRVCAQRSSNTPTPNVFRENSNNDKIDGL